MENDKEIKDIDDKNESFGDIFSMFEKEESFSDIYSLFDDKEEKPIEDTRTDEEVLSDIFKEVMSDQEDKNFVLIKKQDFENARKLEFIRLKKEEEERKARLEEQLRISKLKALKKAEEEARKEAEALKAAEEALQEEVTEEIKPEEEIITEPVKEDTENNEAVSETELKEETDKTENEPVKLKKKKQFNLKYLYLIPLLVLLGTALFMGYRYLGNGNQKIDVEKQIAKEQKEYTNPMDENLRREYLTNRNISEDYVGQIYFESGLLSEPLVQAKDKTYTYYDKQGDRVKNSGGNEVYAWTDWKKMEKANPSAGTGASSYLNINSSTDDGLIIVNGVSWMTSKQDNADSNLNLTALEALAEISSYYNNNEFSLVLDNEIRSYKICAVFDMNVNDEIGQKLLNDTSMNKDYLRHIIYASYYLTGTQMKDNDNYLMLVIRHRDNDDSRFCILGVEKKKQIFGE